MAFGCEEVILSEAAETAIANLADSASKEAPSILKRIAAHRARLKADAQAGEVIPFPLHKKAKPLEVKHAPLHNLYCLDLPDFWRLLYTIVRIGGQRYVIVLEIVDHAGYDKWFPNKGH
ncbi:MAG: hypothetical protein ACYDBQ_11545 [Thermoplasmatota archaeon]